MYILYIYIIYIYIYINTHIYIYIHVHRNFMKGKKVKQNLNLFKAQYVEANLNVKMIGKSIL